jgi:hypothetical protein
MKVDDTADNAERCACPGCPTYNDCMKAGAQAIYCARGVSDCDVKPATCVCGKCTVWAKYSLDDYYFCVQGAAE